MPNAALYINLKKAPFVRLLIALIAGILLKFYLSFSATAIIITPVVVIVLFIACLLLPQALRYTLRHIQGLLILATFMVAGAAITYLKDVSNQHNFVSKFYQPGAPILLTLQEPLVNKPKSYKAVASIDAVYYNNHWQPTKGRMLVYFKKEASKPNLGYGSQLVLNKALQSITNSGNPGAFDYRRFCAFDGIYYQVFITSKDYKSLQQRNTQWLQSKLYTIRLFVIETIQKYISNKREQGVAEALIIGYRNDLDKELVQTYSNTGVVHIIAISGLHLGMIYLLMLRILSTFKTKRWYNYLKPVLILFVLWTFTLIAGGAPSILRAAVMFSFIVVGQSLNRKTNIYNTLAASAFCLLVYNPFFLWAVGFQLSYAAVASIVTFYPPINKLVSFTNKGLQKVWSLVSVTVSAQILTLPFVLYHFHQFPNYVLLTNLIVVPILAFVLYGEILLILFSVVPFVANIIGKILNTVIWFINSFIVNTSKLPFSITDSIQISVVQALLLFVVIISFAIWLMRIKPAALLTGLTAMAVFLLLRAADFIQHAQQSKLIVYNVPQYEAIDIAQGTQRAFIGDSMLLQNGFLQNFHLRPGRILNRTNSSFGKAAFSCANNCITSTAKKVVVVNSPISNYNGTSRISADVIILSKNPKIYISDLLTVFNCSEIVFDSSNPLWKIEKWKKDCEHLHLRFHSVPEQGAFIMDL